MKIQGKVPIKAGFTDKSRYVNAEKAKTKWEKKGWTVVNRIDGGMTGTSYLELEKEDNTKQNKSEPIKNNNQQKSKGGKFKKAMKGIAGFFIFLVILRPLQNNTHQRHTVKPVRLSFLTFGLFHIFANFPHALNTLKSSVA